MQHRIATLVTAVLISGCSLQAHAQEQKPNALGAPPDGIYECGKISGSMYMLMGNLVFAGDMYQGLTDTAAPSPYIVNGDDTLSLTGGLEGFDDVEITDVRYHQSSTGDEIIAIYYTSQSGWAELIDCMLP